MKTILALLASTLLLSANSITLISNTGSAAWEQSLIFELRWPSGPENDTLTFAGDAQHVTQIRLRDFGDAGGLKFYLETTDVTWLNSYSFGAPGAFSRDLDDLWTTSGGGAFATWPKTVNSPMLPFTWMLDVDALPGEPTGGRFTFTSTPNDGFAGMPDPGGLPFSVPDTAATAPLLVLALGLLALAHRKCVARN